MRCEFLAASLLAVSVAGASAQSLPLIPIPREVQAGATVALPQGLRIVCASCGGDVEDAFTVEDLKESLAARGISTSGPVTVTLTRGRLTAEMAAQGYSIVPAGNGLTLTAASGTGLFYAAQTLKQLVEHDGAAAVLRQATVRDWPAMEYRGVSDDLSRGPVPTLEFQEHMVRTLASYKVNVYSPYFEHTQQYASNPLMAPPGGSISAADARALVAYAARYHVTVIPEQEAFGHLHHNLTWEQYGDLAETPHGSVLAPGQPGSLKVIGQMFTELAAMYPGPFLHVGADETADLGLGQTKDAVDTRGLGPVYLNFMQAIQKQLAPLNRRLLFWGDIAQSVVQGSTAYSVNAGASTPDKVNPDILKNLPESFKKGTIAVAWWYSPHPSKGFASFLTPFTAAGFETWVAPGVNNWSSIYPDNNDALVNIQQFTAEGQRQHSTGQLDTIWYDDGEALANNNWYGLVFGAAAAWQAGESSIPAYQQSFGPVFHGDYTGAVDEAQQELMLCHALLRNQAKVGNGSDGLFWLDPWSKDGLPTAAKIRSYLHELRTHAERALTLIAQARAAAPPLPQQLVPQPPAPASQYYASAPPVYNAADSLPSNPTSLHYPDALDALELGARRFDFIGLKFQLADEIPADYNQALAAAASTDKKTHALVGHHLGEIRAVHGRLEDIRDTYALLRGLYEQTWLRSNRPYALRPVLGHFDDTISLWQSRIDRFRSVQRQYAETKTLPTPADLGLPR